MASVASVPDPLKRRVVAPVGTWASKKLPDALGVAEMLVPGTSTRSPCEVLTIFPWMVAPAICGPALPEPQPASNSKPTPIDPMLIRMTVLLPQRGPQLGYLTRDPTPVGQKSDPLERRSSSCRFEASLTDRRAPQRGCGGVVERMPICPPGRAAARPVLSRDHEGQGPPQGSPGRVAQDGPGRGRAEERHTPGRVPDRFGHPHPRLADAGRRRRAQRRRRREVPARPGVSRAVPVYAGTAAEHVPGAAVDDAPVSRIRNAGGH